MPRGRSSRKGKAPAAVASVVTTIQDDTTTEPTALLGHDAKDASTTETSLPPSSSSSSSSSAMWIQLSQHPLVDTESCRMDGCTETAIVAWKKQTETRDEVWNLCESCGNDKIDQDNSTTTTNNEQFNNNQHATVESETGATTTADKETTSSDNDKSLMGPVETLEDANADAAVDTQELPSRKQPLAPLVDGNKNKADGDDSTAPPDNDHDHNKLVITQDVVPVVQDATMPPTTEHQQPTVTLGANEDRATEIMPNTTAVETTERNAVETLPDTVVDATIGEEADEVEGWDLKQILSTADLAKDSPIKCSTRGCSLLACCLYVSDQSGEKWYGCLDCQAVEYGGWPDPHEMPVQHIADEHKKALVERCASEHHKYPEWPDFETSESPLKAVTGDNGLVPTQVTVTPPPAAVYAGATQSKPNNKIALTQGKTKAPAAALAAHAKWQQAAEAAGGPGARIIVQKPVAKEKIFQPGKNIPPGPI